MRPLALFALVAAASAGESGPAGRFLGVEEGLPSARVLALCTGGEARIWVATDAGLCAVEPYGIRAAGPKGAPDRLAPAPDGAVLAAYGGRVALVRPDGWEWRTAAAALPPGPRTLEHHGERWEASADRGIARRRVEPRFERIPIGGTERIHTLAATRDATIWCGTPEGLVHVGPEGVVERITEIDGRPLGVVTACAVDRKGRLWVGSGSAFRGVYCREQGSWRHRPTIDGFVHRIATDPTGALWFAVLGGGAWRHVDGRFERSPAVAELPSARVYDVVARDPSGVLWFATLEGLAAYGGKNRIAQYTKANGLRGSKVWSLCAARDGSLWIGYQTAHGASLLHRGTLRHFGMDDGLCDGNVWSIVEGRPGVFWFATENGLSRYDGRRWSCFRGEEGLAAVPLWPLLPRPDGTLFIGTLGAGLVKLHPRRDEPPVTRPVAARVEVAAGERALVRWQGSDWWYDTPAADLWYRWRIDGGAWEPAKPRRSALLRAAPGEHVVEIQAIDRFGHAERQPARVTVVVGSPDETALFWLLATGAAAAGWLIGRRAKRGS